MRVAGEAVARQAGIENGDVAAGTAELQGAGETGKAAADDDDVIHGDGLRVVDGGGWAGLVHERLQLIGDVEAEQAVRTAVDPDDPRLRGPRPRAGLCPRVP